VGPAIAGLEVEHLAMVHCQGGYIIVPVGKTNGGKLMAKWGNPLQGRKGEEQDVNEECKEDEQRQSMLA
jgi:hypothetical protein